MLKPLIRPPLQITDLTPDGWQALNFAEDTFCFRLKLLTPKPLVITSMRFQVLAAHRVGSPPWEYLPPNIMGKTGIVTRDTTRLSGQNITYVPVMDVPVQDNWQLKPYMPLTVKQVCALPALPLPLPNLLIGMNFDATLVEDVNAPQVPDPSRLIQALGPLISSNPAGPHTDSRFVLRAEAKVVGYMKPAYGYNVISTRNGATVFQS